MFPSELSEPYPKSQLVDHAKFRMINLPLTNHKTDNGIDRSVELILLTEYGQVAIGLINLRHVSIQDCFLTNALRVQDLHRFSGPSLFIR
jgi:hypothetical protein